MRKLLPVLFLFLLLPSSTGQSLDSMYFVSLDDEVKSYADSFDSYLLVDAMATWCNPCIRSLPMLQNVYDIRSSVVDFLSLSISYDFDNTSLLREFQLQYKVNWTMGFDANATFLESFQILYIPMYFLFSPGGELLGVLNATQAKAERDLLALIDTHIPNNLTNPYLDDSSTLAGLSISKIVLGWGTFAVVMILIVSKRHLKV